METFTLIVSVEVGLEALSCGHQPKGSSGMQEDGRGANQIGLVGHEPLQANPGFPRIHGIEDESVLSCHPDEQLQLMRLTLGVADTLEAIHHADLVMGQERQTKICVQVLGDLNGDVLEIRRVVAHGDPR